MNLAAGNALTGLEIRIDSGCALHIETAVQNQISGDASTEAGG
jgi:hypothetical protein